MPSPTRFKVQQLTYGFRMYDSYTEHPVDVEMVDATSGVSGLRTITSVPDADTFVTNASNSGATPNSKRTYLHSGSSRRAGNCWHSTAYGADRR